MKFNITNDDYDARKAIIVFLEEQRDYCAAKIVEGNWTSEYEEKLKQTIKECDIALLGYAKQVRQEEGLNELTRLTEEFDGYKSDFNNEM
jgi:hypothetical protein